MMAFIVVLVAVLVSEVPMAVDQEESKTLPHRQGRFQEQNSKSFHRDLLQVNAPD